MSDKAPAAKAEKQTKQKTTKTKWSLKKKIAVIVGAFVVFFVLLFTIANVATDAPLKVSNEFVANIQSGDAEDAYELMSAEAQAIVDPETFEMVVDQIGPILNGEPNNTSKQVSAETGSDPVATIIYEIKGRDSFTYTFTVTLDQVDGNWQVRNFDSTKKD